MRRFRRAFVGRVRHGDVSDAVLKALRIGRKVPTSRVVTKWRSLVEKLLPLGGLSSGNRLTLFGDGDAAFLSMWNSIASAQKRVWLETYVLMPDEVGLRTISLLEQAAARGCDVRVLYDSVGSWQLQPSHVEALKKTGAHVVIFHPVRAEFSLSFLHRNHRKVLIVDDGMAYCGGMNVASEYAGLMSGGNCFFADVHVKVEGPAAADLADVFSDSMQEALRLASPGLGAWMMWAFAVVRSRIMGETRPGPPTTTTTTTPSSSVQIPLEDYTTPLTSSGQVTVHTARSSLVQVLMSNVRREKMHIQRALPMAIRSAQHRCYITSPYFLPPRRVKDALLDAASRGVDVRIITAGRTDVALAKFAGRHLQALFVKYGIKVYEMRSAALHAKLCVIDDVYTTIGSFNLDVMSNTRNLEVSLHVLDPHLAQAASEQMSRFLAWSRLVTPEELMARSWSQKVGHWLAYHVARLPQVSRSPIIGDDVS